MHCGSPISRGDGEEASEGYRRLGQGGLYGAIIIALLLKEVQELSLPLLALQEFDLRNTQSLEESVRHSDVVYNLVGRRYPTKYGSQNLRL